MMSSRFTAKLEDYARLDEHYRQHSAKIHRMEWEIDNLKQEQGMLKTQLTPRDGPATHREMGTERRPEMYFPRTGDEGPNDHDTKRDESGYKGLATDQTGDRPFGATRRPGMYYIDVGKDDSPRDLQTPRDKRGDFDTNRDRPVYHERRHEMYASDGNRYNDYSPRKDENFDVEALREKERENKYSFYDSTAINPHKKKETGHAMPWDNNWKMASPGGLGVIRFRDSEFEKAKVAIQRLHSVMRTTGGYLMGMSRKDKIYVYETASQKELCWPPSRQQDSPDYMRTDAALIMLWFASREAAENFFACRHGNEFKEPNFPEPEGHEAFYTPLIIAPSAKPMPTFLFIEILHARNFPPENFANFEGELREEMLKLKPTCQPIASSSVTGRQYFKPGNMVSPYSKLIISRFDSQKHVDEVWRSGIIRALLQRHSLIGMTNIASFTISDVV